MTTVALAKKIIEDQHSTAEAKKGYAYAESIGYVDGEEFFSLAVARILYSDSQLEDCNRYPVEPGSLDEYFAD